MATFVVLVDDQTVENRERQGVENKIRVLEKVTGVEPLFPDELPSATPQNPVVKSMSKFLLAVFDLAAGSVAEISDAAARLQTVKGVEKVAHAPMLDKPYRARACGS